MNIDYYKLRAEIFFEDKVKPVLCHDNFTGNLLHWAWKDLDCACCAFFRGFLMAAIISVSVAIFIKMVL